MGSTKGRNKFQLFILVLDNRFPIRVGFAAASSTTPMFFYDNRNDPGNKLIETFQAFSADDGTTWTNFNISTAAWDPDKSFFSCGCFIGDYNGLAASNAVIYPVWTDGRNSPGAPNGETEIFTNVEIR